jgi:hypothetical protein
MMNKLIFLRMLLILALNCFVYYAIGQDARIQARGTDKSLLNNSPDSKANSIRFTLQGVWAGPDESYYFRFRGDSVKEWESEGADSSQKPYCSYVISHVACDSNWHNDSGSTNYFLLITCTSPDNVETRCYSILSVTASDLKIGFRGKYDESGHFKKINGNDQ